MVQHKFTVDLNKPLAFQVGHLGEDYDEWVHKPIISKESPRLYENDLLEYITLTPWWVVPVFWLPIVFWMVGLSLKHGISSVDLPPTIVAGVFALSLFEYLLHRFVFHFKPSTYWGITVHYMFHGFHHKHPSDTLRLVLSPAVTLIIAAILWGVNMLVIPAPHLFAFIAGEMLGYVLYDCTHYYLHHGRSLDGVLGRLKRNHMNHHFKGHDKGYGVTSNFWDRVFGTMPLPAKSANKYN